MNSTNNHDLLIRDEMPIDQDDESLVAYLDNELSRDERAGLENRLVGEASLRSRLSELEMGWEMLAEIPDESSGQHFVETTLEMAVTDLETSSANKKQGPVSSIVRIAMMSVVMCLVTFAVHTWKQASNFNRQLEDMAISQTLDAYARGGDIELLRQLAADSQWEKMTATVREFSGRSKPVVSLRNIPNEDREVVLKSMERDDRMKIQSRWLRFQRLSEAHQEAIRNNAAAISQQPDREQLIVTATAYARWRDQVDDQWVVQMESGDAVQRRDAIHSALDQSRAEIARLPSLRLNEETVERIYFVLTETLQRRLEGNKRLKSVYHAMRRKRPQGFDPRWYVIHRCFRSTENSRPSDRPPLRPLTDDELSDIRLILSEESNEQIEMVAAGDAYLESLTIRLMVDEAIRRKSPLNQDATLMERFEQLKEHEREQLQWLPADKILERLTNDQPSR